MLWYVIFQSLFLLVGGHGDTNSDGVAPQKLNATQRALHFDGRQLLSGLLRDDKWILIAIF